MRVMGRNHYIWKIGSAIAVSLWTWLIFVLIESPVIAELSPVADASSWSQNVAVSSMAAAPTAVTFAQTSQVQTTRISPAVSPVNRAEIRLAQRSEPPIIRATSSSSDNAADDSGPATLMEIGNTSSVTDEPASLDGAKEVVSAGTVSTPAEASPPANSAASSVRRSPGRARSRKNSENTKKSENSPKGDEEPRATLPASDGSGIRDTMENSETKVRDPGTDESLSAVPEIDLSTLPPAKLTKLRRFTVPFQVPNLNSANPTLVPQLVQLLGSVDSGRTWYIVGMAYPQQKQFVFQTSGDQEYWFRVRTLNAYGMSLEAESRVPQLRVTVDTTAPELSLVAQAYQRPDVTEPQTLVRWRVQDAHFSPEKFRLLVWNVTDSSWKEVSFPNSCWDGADPIWDGEVVCPYPPAETTVFRAEAFDLAGNFISKQTGVTESAGTVSDGSDPTAAPKDPFYPSEVAAAEAEQKRRQPGTSTVNSGGWRGTVQTGPMAQNGKITGEDTMASDKSEDGLVSIDLLPAYNGRTPADLGRFRGLPEGVWPQMSNSRYFEIDYDVSAVGPSGVAKVELWGTRDGGKTWRRFSEDADRVSPISVTLSEEGWYGFIVTVQSGAGVGGTPPESGDKAQVWIGVDRTPPYGRFLEVKYEAGKLVAKYEIEEVWLAERPIRFYYAAQQDGPWTPIGTENLDATGTFIWTLDPSIPARFYLRMEMRDRAGNIGRCDYSEQLIADRVQPSVTIRRVSPVTQVQTPASPNP